MVNLPVRILVILFVLLCFAEPGFSEKKLSFGDFAQSGLQGWQSKKFKGETRYEIVEDGATSVLRATSKASASGLVYETEYDPADYPVLSWRWKIDHIIEAGNSLTKAGDDYAARVYVVFPHWFFPKTRSLNYIWANRLAKDSFQPNAYTSNAMMIAVESGPEKSGQWQTVRRNIVEDYRRAFGEDPPKVGAIAIMTDTDNTGEHAVAWYADIAAHSE